jgi:peptide/nickel transport system substrate-binding protein
MTGIADADCTGPDPDDSFLWNSKWIPSSPTGAGANLNAYFHKFAFQQQIDDLTNAGLTTVDPSRRRAIYFKLQNLLADEVPSIFLYWVPKLMVLPKDLHGFVASSFSGPLWNVATWRRG